MLETFVSFIKNNPFLAGSLMVILSGTITSLIKEIPLRIYRFILNQITTSVEIVNFNVSYYNFLSWYEKNEYKKYSRNFSLTNGKWGADVKSTLSAGKGTHFFVKNGTLFFFSITEQTGGNSENVKLAIKLSFFGRDTDKMTKFIDSIKPISNRDKTQVYDLNGDHWQLLVEEDKRNFDTVCLNSEAENKIVTHLDQFFSSKQRYLDRGIPYRTTILLHGPPGTGKTSIIKALAAKYNKNINTLNIDTISPKQLRNALCRSANSSIIAIEDIDSLSSIHKRTNKEPETSVLNEGGISTILNAFDGIGTFSDKVVIMTTNHIEKLDTAMLRAGRVDLIVEISELDSASIKRYLKRNCKDLVIPEFFEFAQIKGCELQQIVQNNKQEDLLNLLKVKNFTSIKFENTISEIGKVVNE